MNSRCDICIEEDCKESGKLSYCSDCNTCVRARTCKREIKAAIRITNRCTQECSHCMFCSSPRSTRMLSLETANLILSFLISNGITSITITGGEFYCNPDWKEILKLFLKSGSIINVRLLTNGDWAGDDKFDPFEFIELCLDYREKLFIFLSEDEWHNKENIDIADGYLQGIEAYYCKTDLGVKEETLLPLGRSENAINKFSISSSPCLMSQEVKYTILIDEKGKIYKCMYGVSCFGKVQDFLQGGFRGVFKRYNQLFYSNLKNLNCKVCSKLSNESGCSIDRL